MFDSAVRPNKLYVMNPQSDSILFSLRQATSDSLGFAHLLRKLNRALLGAACILCPASAWSGYGSIDVDNKTLNLSILFSYDETDDNLESAATNPDWREVFNDASRRLWNASNGQLKIGKITVYRRAISKKDEVDSWILQGDGGAYANLSGLGRTGYRMTFFQDRHRSITANNQGGFSVVHEIGHYVFGLYDQYLGAYVPFSKKDSWTQADLSGFQESVFVNSVSASDANASIMDGGGTVNNNRTEFDTASNVNRGQREGNKWWMNKQWIENQKESCWETLAKFQWRGRTVFPNVPTGDSPTDLPAGLTDVDWEVVPTLSRLVLCIDRSGSMDEENRMDLAKVGAKLFTRLTEERHTFAGRNGKQVVFEGDRLGIVDFDSSVTTTFPISEIDVAGTKRNEAVSAIDTLFARGGTAIGSGAQRALELIEAQGERVAQEAIILLSDGQNNAGIPPATAASNAAVRGAKIYAIALGSGADSATLSSMAAATGGKFYQASSGLGLVRIYPNIFAELRGGGLIQSVASLLSEKTSDEHDVLIDDLVEETTITVASPSDGFAAELLSPTGKSYSASNAEDNVLYQNADNIISFRVSAPDSGVWKLKVSAPNSDTGSTYRYNFIASSSDTEVSVAPDTDQKVYTHPQPVLVTCQVTATHPVAGAIVTGEISGPDGVLGKMTLYDDGLPLHGDKEANDGTYSGFYSAFPASGTYTFDLNVENKRGVAAITELEDTIEPRQIIKIPPFSRSRSVSVQVDGVPDVDQQWLRVDSLKAAASRKNPQKAGAKLRLTLNAPQFAFTPGLDSLRLSLDGETIEVPAQSFSRRNKPGVFKILDKERGISGMLRANIGGSSRHELLLSCRDLQRSQISFDDSTRVGVSFGQFLQTVDLTTVPAKSGGRMSYDSKSNFATTRVLYVDGLRARINHAQNQKDSVRLVASLESPGTGFDPAKSTVNIRLGSLQMAIPPGTFQGNGNKYKGILEIWGGQVLLSLDLDRRIVTMKGSKLNTGGGLQQSSVIGLSMPGFDEANLLTFQSKPAKQATRLVY